MRNKKILFISIFILMIVLSIGAVSAQDADNAVASTDDGAVASTDDDAVAATNDDSVLEDSNARVSGTVSGGVDVVTENPNEYSGDLSYDIPKDAKTIKSADVYVNVYGVTTDDRYGANVNTTIKTANGDTPYNETLFCVNDEEDHSIVHNLSDHVNKVYLNYMIHYDIKDLISGLNGTKLAIHVDSYAMEGKSFDGKIKLIALVLAYNDDSTDETISYWVNDDQLWTKSNVTLNFNTMGKSGVSTLTNIVLSSADGSYKLNGDFLGDADTHVTGSTYQYNQWDVTSRVDKTKNTILNVAPSGNGAWGSIRNSLSVLTINDIQSTMSVATEYSNTAFAGTNNTLSVSLSASKSGKYIVKLFADGVVVDELEVNLTSTSQPFFLTDPTIRPVNESTEKGADNNKVNYTVKLFLDGATVNSTSINVPILYNGYLGKDLAYPAGGMESLPLIIINGDIKIDVQDVSTKLGGSNMYRTDSWTVNLGEDSTVVKSFIYVPYNWFKPNLLTEDLNMFNTTFNGVKVTPIALYRDQGNLGGASAIYGYGVLVYDVTDLINKSGTNSFVLNKLNETPAVYPSVLIYMYNTTNSNYIKEIYINHGADLLTDHSTSLTNYANRTAKADSTIKVNPKVTSNATLYVFASNAMSNYGDIVFNGETHKNVWNGASSCTDYKEFDVTGKIKDTNTISVVGTDGSLLALQQIMVLTKNVDDVEITLTPEYTTSGALTAYAGTENAITIIIEAVKAGKVNATLLANGNEVNKTEINLVVGTNKFILTDPTKRPVNATTVNGAVNDKVNYTLQLSSGRSATIVIPILYNGNLGKNLAYPAGGMESFLNITINGDIVIDAKDASTKLGSADMTRTDDWTVNLDAKSSIVKSYIYVPYNWFNPNLGIAEDFNMFNATFNGAKVTPIALYKDQGNLGGYGRYSYGVLVYDVTNLTRSGQNSFVINKLVKTPSVYPSVLLYMYNTTGSVVIRNVYISNGADLLSKTTGNVAGRTVKADSTIDVAAIADTAKLYVVASNAMADYGSLVFNGQTYENIWSGASYATEVYELDITNSIKKSNDISFVATGGSILALQQIIVTTQKAKTAITAPSVTTIYNTNKNFVVTLKDAKGNAVANAKVTVVLNGAKKVLTTNSKGQATLAIPANLVPKTYAVSITYAGDATHIKSSASSKVIVKKATVKLTAKKKTFKKKVKVKKYTVTLKDNKGKVMKKVKLTLKVKGKTYKATTNAKGKATFKIKKLTKKGKYTAKVTYKGDKYFNAKTAKVKITVKK